MQAVPKTDDTFCIGVLGDFLEASSDDPATSGVAWTPRRATPDTVLRLAGLRPELSVGGGGDEATRVELSSLEGFDPVHLFEHLPRFAPLRVARERVGEARAGTPSPQREGSSPSHAGSPLGPNLLDSILDQAEAESGVLESEDELESFVRRVVRPHLVRDESEIRRQRSALDEQASAYVSELLHVREFQRLEAVWRSLVFLLSQADASGSGKVRVYFVHLPKDELRKDLEGVEEPSASKLYGLLSSPDLGVAGRRWAVVAGIYPFRVEPRDLSLLEGIAGVARAADVPWLSSLRVQTPETGHGGIIESFGDAGDQWARFRRSPEAEWLGLTYPRFLLREPHERSARGSKGFAFREKVEGQADLLWGDGAILCLALLAQGFAAGGWGFRPEDHAEVGGMPLVEIELLSGARPTSVEIRLTMEMAADAVRTGLIPIIGMPERAGIRIGGLHSCSASGAPISGWWR